MAKQLTKGYALKKLVIKGNYSELNRKRRQDRDTILKDFPALKEYADKITLNRFLRNIKL